MMSTQVVCDVCEAPLNLPAFQFAIAVQRNVHADFNGGKGRYVEGRIELDVCVKCARSLNVNLTAKLPPLEAKPEPDGVETATKEEN
jgi:hypothetical protein